VYPVEFAKKHLIFSWTVTIVLTYLTVRFSIKGIPVDGLSVVTPLSWAETAAATGFYYWKAKNENRAKYAQRFLNKIADKYGADVALRMAEIVLKD
jgi:hypothetical protein